MKSSEVLIPNPSGSYQGYLPQAMWEHEGEPMAWDACKQLLRIPHKITHFFDRGKIVEVRKSNHEKNGIDNYYLMKLIDGSFLEVEY